MKFSWMNLVAVSLLIQCVVVQSSRPAAHQDSVGTKLAESSNSAKWILPNQWPLQRPVNHHLTIWPNLLWANLLATEIRSSFLIHRNSWSRLPQ